MTRGFCQDVNEVFGDRELLQQKLKEILVQIDRLHEDGCVDLSMNRFFLHACVLTEFVLANVSAKSA